MESLLKDRISSEIKLKLEKYNSPKWLLIIPDSLNKIIIEHKSFFYDINSSKNIGCERFVQIIVFIKQILNIYMPQVIY